MVNRGGAAIEESVFIRGTVCTARWRYLMHEESILVFCTQFLVNG